MADPTAFTALALALLALLIALLQLTQQVMATSYVIRKCDTLVTGGVVRGGVRVWHWRQFRFTVRYQGLRFSLPPKLYPLLGVNAAVETGNGDVGGGGGARTDAAGDGGVGSSWEMMRVAVGAIGASQFVEGRTATSTTLNAATTTTNLSTSDDQGEKHEGRMIFERAKRRRVRRETGEQACWVSLVQDAVEYGCVRAEDLSTAWESADRVPEDLTVLPVKVDILTVMLIGVALGMKVSRYAPESGEVSMAGGLGAISSSQHPVLGTLLRYSVHNDEPTTGSEAARRHGRALLRKRAVWANCVFARFRDIGHSYRSDFVPFKALRGANIPILQENGWDHATTQQHGSTGILTESIETAAAFMSFASVDVYLMVPPSSAYNLCPHFSEVIILWHLRDMRGKPVYRYRDNTVAEIDRVIHSGSATSPFRHISSTISIHEAFDRPLDYPDDRLTAYLLGPELDKMAKTYYGSLYDPSTWMSMPTAYDTIVRADFLIGHLDHLDPGSRASRQTKCIMARAISSLAGVGAPSWGHAEEAINLWGKIFANACRQVLGEDGSVSVDGGKCDNGDNDVVVRAELSTLRAAYFCLMMRSSGDVGPGISEDMQPTTALAHML